MLSHLWCLDGGTVQDVSGINSQSGNNPGDGETGEECVTDPLVVGVLAHLGGLKIKTMTRAFYLKEKKKNSESPLK